MPFTMRLPFVGGTPRGRAAKGTAAVAAVAFAATLAVAPSANATGYNWQHWTPSGNCFAWTTWNANQVQGHVHNVPDVPKQASGSSAIAWNSGDYAATPSWWHGPGYNQVLIDEICVYQNNDPTYDPGECSPHYN